MDAVRVGVRTEWYGGALKTEQSKDDEQKLNCHLL